MATLCGAPTTSQDIAFSWPGYTCDGGQLCEACRVLRHNLRSDLDRQKRQDPGIRTDGIFCADDCRHLAGARYGAFRCTGFTLELTPGPYPTRPFRCQKCLDMMPSKQEATR
jgi:hypothetical protein